MLSRHPSALMICPRVLNEISPSMVIEAFLQSLGNPDQVHPGERLAEQDSAWLAEACEFEEIVHLLVRGKLPTLAELKAYKPSSRTSAACRPVLRPPRTPCRLPPIRWT